MTEWSVSNLRDAFQLVASLEAHSQQLRQTGGSYIHAVVTELERLLLEIRDELKPLADSPVRPSVEDR